MCHSSPTLKNCSLLPILSIAQIFVLYLLRLLICQKQRIYLLLLGYLYKRTQKRVSPETILQTATSVLLCFGERPLGHHRVTPRSFETPEFVMGEGLKLSHERPIIPSPELASDSRFQPTTSWRYFLGRIPLFQLQTLASHSASAGVP